MKKHEETKPQIQDRNTQLKEWIRHERTEQIKEIRSDNEEEKNKKKTE